MRSAVFAAVLAAVAVLVPAFAGGYTVAQVTAPAPLTIPEAIERAGLIPSGPKSETWYYVVTKQVEGGPPRGAVGDAFVALAEADKPPGKYVVERCDVRWDVEPPLGKVVTNYCTFEDVTLAEVRAARKTLASGGGGFPAEVS